MIHDLLSRYEFIFYVALGTWKTKPVDIKLQSEANPYHAKPYPVTRSHKYIFNKEMEIIFQPGELKN